MDSKLRKWLFSKQSHWRVYRRIRGPSNEDSEFISSTTRRDEVEDYWPDMSLNYADDLHHASNKHGSHPKAAGLKVSVVALGPCSRKTCMKSTVPWVKAKLFAGTI